MNTSITIEREAQAMGFPPAAATLISDFAKASSRTKSAKARAQRVRRCRKCGCTDMDCRQCVERTGSPCHWVEADLCSACAPAPLTPAARTALRLVGTAWQKVPHSIRGSHLAVLIRHNHIEHRWPFDLTARLMAGQSYPWLRDGEIRRIVRL